VINRRIVIVGGASHTARIDDQALICLNHMGKMAVAATDHRRKDTVQMTAERRGVLHKRKPGADIFDEIFRIMFRSPVTAVDQVVGYMIKRKALKP